MRKVVLSQWITFDGYSADMGTEVGAYMAGVEDPAQDAYFLQRVRSVGEHAMGSTTYTAMAGYWPTRDDDVAEVMNRLPKLVFSHNPDLPTPWGPVRLVTEDTAAAFAALKAEDGGDILVHGGNTFVHSLLTLDLVDELRLAVLPVAVGAGVPLFPDRGRLQRLRLLGTTAFPSGIQEVVLAPERD
ncbi:MAG TPA: dihydrofolate reductase family protein [Actinocatenispora sp.]